MGYFSPYFSLGFFSNKRTIKNGIIVRARGHAEGGNRQWEQAEEAWRTMLFVPQNMPCTCFKRISGGLEILTVRDVCEKTPYSPYFQCFTLQKTVCLTNFSFIHVRQKRLYTTPTKGIYMLSQKASYWLVVSLFLYFIHFLLV